MTKDCVAWGAGKYSSLPAWSAWIVHVPAPLHPTPAGDGAVVATLLPSKNYFYAIRIHGAFSLIMTRAIPIQFLPYPPLSQLTPIQSVFSYSNVTGTAVDIRSPAFVAGINQVAHHYHFVSDDLKGGGHALSFTTGQVVVSIQTLRRYELVLPGDELFQKATLPFVQ